MLLLGVLFAVITVGFVVPCLIDAARTPPQEYGRLSREAWLVIIGGFWVLGAAVWLMAGKPRRGRPAPPPPPRAAYRPRGHGRYQARHRHPAWRPVQPEYAPLDMPGELSSPADQLPRGPDDDPEFLMELERRIREARGD
jgi:hypothetical protein